MSNVYTLVTRLRYKSGCVQLIIYYKFYERPILGMDSLTWVIGLDKMILLGVKVSISLRSELSIT